MSIRTLPQVSSLPKRKSPPLQSRRVQYLEDLLPRLKQLPETTRVVLELTPSQSEHIQKLINAEHASRERRRNNYQKQQTRKTPGRGPAPKTKEQLLVIAVDYLEEGEELTDDAKSQSDGEDENSENSEAREEEEEYT